MSGCEGGNRSPTPWTGPGASPGASDISLLKGPTMFLQAQVQRSSSRPGVCLGALSTRDAVDDPLSFGHWDWVLGMDQLLLQGLERAEQYPDGKWAEDPSDGL